MCIFKSAIILKDRVFVPDYEHHSKMLEELGISDTRSNAERLFVRAELSPIDGDVFSNIETWNFKVDQDILPDWFVKEVDKKRMIKAVKEWAEKHILVGVANLQLTDGSYYVRNCKGVEASGDATVIASGDATVEASGGATVEAWGDVRVRASDEARVEASGDATVIASDYATVEASGRARVEASGYATVEAWGGARVEASGSATVEASGSARVRASDEARVGASGSATVEAWGSARVRASDSATVEAWGSARVRASGDATVIIPIWSSNKRENITIKDSATLKDVPRETIYQAGGWTFVKVDET